MALQNQRDTDAGYGAVEGMPEDLTALAASATMTVADALEQRPSLPALPRSP